MLIWSDSKKEITEIPKTRKKFYQNGKSKLTDEEYQKLKDYVNVLIDNTLEKESKDNRYFVPGWQAPGSWVGTPLNIIWEKIFPGDTNSCALWYGLLVMKVLIDKDEYWYATKTNYNRDFDQMSYWIEAEKTESEFATK